MVIMRYIIWFNSKYSVCCLHCVCVLYGYLDKRRSFYLTAVATCSQ